MAGRRKVAGSRSGNIVELPATDGANAKAVEVVDPLAGYSPDFLQCRVDRHRWGRKAVWSLVAANLSERIRQCEVCGTKVVQVVNTRTWARMGPTRYRYAPGYTRRGQGLVLADFREAHFRGDYARAEKDGRISQG